MKDKENENKSLEQENNKQELSLNKKNSLNTTIIGQNEQESGASKEWGKLACVAAVVVQLIVLGQYHCSGIIYSALLKEYKVGRGNTALILSLASSATHAFGPLTAYLTERYGSWPVSFTGGILCSLGLLFSSFCPVVPLLYLFYGLAWGLGSCMCHRASLAIMCKYFEGQFLVVNSTSWIGCALATLALSPLMQHLFREYETVMTFRIMAGAQLVLLVCSLLFIPFARKSRQAPHPAGDRNERDIHQDSVFSFEVFKRRRFLLWILAVVFLMLINLVPLVHVIQFAQDTHVDVVNTAMLVSYLAIGSSTGRLFFGRLLNSVHGHNRIRVIQFGLLCIGVFSLVLPVAVQDFCLALYVLVFGFFEGCFATLIPVVTMDIVGTDLIPSGLTWLYTIAAFPEALGPPIAGWLYDETGSYSMAFYLFGGTALFTIILLAPLQFCCLRSPDQRCESSDEVVIPMQPLMKRDHSNHLNVPKTELYH